MIKIELPKKKNKDLKYLGEGSITDTIHQC